MLRQGLETELAAATAVALNAGLGTVRPEVLHLGNHTSVRLHPLPFVARIASGTSFDLDGDGFSRELTIAGHLASRGAPAIRPASGIRAGPYLQTECVITLWDYVEGRRVASVGDEWLAAASLRRIHSALENIDVDLPSFLDKVGSCETILTNSVEAPELAAGDRALLHDLYRSLRESLDVTSASWQPLHGDAHIGNAMIANSDAVWLDLKSVCLGPLEWDVGFLPTRTWLAFGPVDTALIRLLADVRQSLRGDLVLG